MRARRPSVTLSPVRRGEGLAACALAFALLVSCDREERRVNDPPNPNVHRERLVSLQPGPPNADVRIRNRYDGNAWAIAEGKRLFTWYNCSGCHANGGGGMGPALMDAKWIYGSAAENIASTILEGRPNGMPSFRGKIPEQQVWQLAAYVRSLSGLVPTDAAAGREDHMFVKKRELATEKLDPEREAARHP